MKRNQVSTGLIALLAVIGFGWAPSSQTSGSATPSFSGLYTELLPEQKRLVDDWFRRFGKTVGKPVSPEEGYNNLPVSAKTTFNGVTHALTRTKLTSADGKVLEKSAVVIIDKVNTVAGSVPGARGDVQFRIYVELRPGTEELLSRSREFRRERDNTMYHRGYPLCFRSNTDTASIQISMSRNGKFADIDVDYRSSKIPACLVNGHLSSANSDVRAGDNDQRHNRNWTGFPSWWSSLLGLPFGDQASDSAEAEKSLIPRAPKITSKQKPEVAVRDFLNSWLVEQKPQVAAAYFADACFACMELELERPVDRGMAKFMLLKAMTKANQQVGKISNLAEISQGISRSDPRLKLIKQPYQSEFVLYDVREDLAEQFFCPNQLDPSLISPKAIQSTSFGKYVGAIFQIKAKNQTSRTLATLWDKKSGYWKLLSYVVDPEWGRLQTPNLQPAVVDATPPLPVVPDDGRVGKVATQFLEEWFVRRNLDQAVQLLSRRCFDCYNIYADDEKPKAKTPEEAAKLLRQAMGMISQKVGRVKSLADGLEAPEPQHEDLKLVRHPAEKAFVMVSLPDYMAEATDCSRLKSPDKLRFVGRAEGKKYGNYYGTGFRLKVGGPEADILWLVWGKEAGSWKIISYTIISP